MENGNVISVCYVIEYPSLGGTQVDPTIYLSYPELPESMTPVRVRDFANVFDAKLHIQFFSLPDVKIAVAA